MKTSFFKFVLVSVLILSMLGLTGCKPKGTTDAGKNKNNVIELTYYKMFDDEDVINALIGEYEKTHQNVRIKYKKFTNLDEYYQLIVDELAEGKGPDIFSAQNYWFLKNRKKISPASADLVPPADFRATFVDVAGKDLVWPDETGTERVYGVPFTVDTLALYYNKDHFEDRLPQQGKPSKTWEGIKEDVYALSKQDSSFERFQVAGIALGRADNITRAVDVLLLMMLQNGVSFYDAAYAKVILGTKGAEALALFNSFADQEQKNYSWNRYLADAQSSEKEISTFAKGKVSMIVGYSYLYDEILNQIEEEAAKGFTVINKSSVKVATIPQISDPDTSVGKRVTYANYFAETVSRTSEHPNEAWDFLLFMASKENSQKYFEQTHKPTSRRDLIEEQKKNPIYGVFVDQIGFAESIPVNANANWQDIFEKMINTVLSGTSVRDAIKIGETELQSLIPTKGLLAY